MSSGLVDKSAKRKDALIDLERLRKHLVFDKELEPNSIRLVLGRWRIFEKWLFESDREITHEAIEDFILFKKEQEHLGNNSLNAYIFAFRMVQSYCAAKGIPWATELDGLSSRRKEEAEIDPLTREEIERLIDIDIQRGLFRGRDSTNYLNTLYRAMIMMLVYTGSRYTNCQRLQVKDIQTDRQVIRLRNLKNHMKFLDAWVPKEVITAIEPLLKGKKPDDLVFVTFNGVIEKDYLRPVPASTFGDELRRRQKIVGITRRVHPHIFRHCFGTRLLENGVNIEHVGKMLGHKDIQSTYRYYDHVSAVFLKMEKFKDPMVMQFLNDEDIYLSVRKRLVDLQLGPKQFLYVIRRLAADFL